MLFIGFRGLSLELDLSVMRWPSLSFSGEMAILRIFALFLIVGASLASNRSWQRLYCHSCPGALPVSALQGLMVLESAPDVALVQISRWISWRWVILVLALARLPRLQRLKAQDVTFRQSPAGLVRDALIASGHVRSGANADHPVRRCFLAPARV